MFVVDGYPQCFFARQILQKSFLDFLLTCQHAAQAFSDLQLGCLGVDVCLRRIGYPAQHNLVEPEAEIIADFKEQVDK